MSYEIRSAQPGDEIDIVRLVKALAAFENEPDAVKVTPEALRQQLFADHSIVFAHVAEMDGMIIGIAVWFLNFSTWTGRPGIYLEDLFIEPDHRGAGIARALFQTLALEAAKRDCPRIDWSVLSWNSLAKDFYRRLGAYHAADWEPWRLEGAALEALRTN